MVRKMCKFPTKNHGGISKKYHWVSPPPVINKIDGYPQNHAGFAGCSLTPLYTNIDMEKTHHFALGDDVKLRFVPV